MEVINLLKVLILNIESCPSQFANEQKPMRCNKAENETIVALCKIRNH
jgi:hypothetical protein